MRLFLSFLAAIFVAGNTFSEEDHSIFVVMPFDNTACLVDTTNYSSAIDLNAYKPIDFNYALQLNVTNLTATNTAGLVTVSYELSNNNVDYLSSSNIVAGITYTNSASGKGFYQFDTGKSRYVRFKAIVTQTNCWINGWLAIQ